MGIIRRNLARLVALWLVCQATSLSAFVPHDCCAAHRVEASSGQECHRPAAETCPMRASDGQPCPMHNANGNSAKTCVMRGTCDAPAVALASLLLPPGLPVAKSVLIVALADSPMAAVAVEIDGITRSLDPPPPRA